MSWQAAKDGLEKATLSLFLSIRFCSYRICVYFCNVGSESTIKGIEASLKKTFLDIIVIAERACNCQVVQGLELREKKMQFPR